MTKTVFPSQKESKLVEELRKRLLSRGPELSEFHEKDIERVQHDNSYVLSFLLHKNLDIERALEMMVDCFKWRKSFGIIDLTERNIDRRLFEIGFLYPHNLDKKNNLLLLFHAKLYKKEIWDGSEVRKLFAFALEKMSISNPGEKITMVFDMQDAQLGNMDSELTKFIITCFQNYFPNMLEYMIVFETPWILTAHWKYLKTLVSSDSLFRIKLVNRVEIMQYIESDQLIQSMGGRDAFVYKYPPQLFSMKKKSLITNLEVKDPDMFSSMSTSIEADMLLKPPEKQSSELSGSSVENSFTDSLLNRNLRESKFYSKDLLENAGPLITISPAQELIFYGSESSQDVFRIITITNTVSSCVAFKIKTTSPENFRVKPSAGPIEPNKSVEVQVHLQPTHDNKIHKDRFLILSAILKEDEKYDLTSIWKTIPKSSIMEQRLRCRFENFVSSAAESDAGSVKVQETNLFSSEEALKGLSRHFVIVEHKIDVVQKKMVVLERNINTVYRLIIFLFIFIIFFVCLLFFYSLGFFREDIMIL